MFKERCKIVYSGDFSAKQWPNIGDLNQVQSIVHPQILFFWHSICISYVSCFFREVAGVCLYSSAPVYEGRTWRS